MWLPTRPHDLELRTNLTNRWIGRRLRFAEWRHGPRHRSARTLCCRDLPFQCVLTERGHNIGLLGRNQPTPEATRGTSMKTCPNCAHKFKVPAFQLWSGRGPQYNHALTSSTRRENRRNRQRQIATSEEFAEFLKHADDLAVIRLRGDEVAQLGALFMVGGFLWAIGTRFRLVEFEYRLFYAVCVGLTFVSVFWRKNIKLIREGF